METPRSYPPELSKALDIIEVHWRNNQNPFYAWRALERCLLWTDPDGRLTGPHQPPIWCLLAFAIWATRIMQITTLDPPPRGEEFQRRIAEALDLTSNGRNALKSWVDDSMRMSEAYVFDSECERGSSPEQAYRMLNGALEGNSVDLKSKHRKRQDRVTKGRRLLKRISGAQKSVH